MQAFARAPNQMSDKGPMDKNWKIFKEQFLTFMKVTEGNLEASDKQAIMLLNLMGEEGQKALQNVSFECPEEKENIQILLQKFDEYFDPPKRVTNERYAFFTRTRKPNESIEDFIAELREKAKTCNFDFLADSLVQDKVILDTKDKLLRNLLLDTDDLDLTKVITIYKSHEMATEKIKQIYKEKTNKAQNTIVTPSTTNTEVANNTINCSRCGTQHTYRNCPAWGKKCGKCQGLGHYTHKCTPNLAQKSHRPNKEFNKNVATPFTQIDKNTKTHNKFRTSSNRQEPCLPDYQIPPLMAPPVYTPYPTATEMYNPGYMRLPASQPAYNVQSKGATTYNNAFVTSESTTKRAPTCSMQRAFSPYSGTGSAPPLDSNISSITCNGQTNGPLYPNLPCSTSSSNDKSTTQPGRTMHLNDSEIIDSTSIIKDFVKIGLDSNSSRRQSNASNQPARSTTETLPVSTSNIIVNSQKRNRQSRESDKCIIS